MARKPFKITDFLGLDNKSAPEDLVAFERREGASYESLALNVDFTKTGSVARRRGWSLAAAGEFHSLWAGDDVTFVVKDGQIGTLDASLAFTALADASDRPFSYADTGAGVYLSDGQQMFVYMDGALTRLDQAGTYDLPQTHLREDSAVYDSPPPGFLLVWMFGKLWSVTDHGIFYSRSMRPDQFNLAQDYIDMPGVTMLLPSDSGYFLGTTEQVLYIAGANPKAPNPTVQVCDFGAIKSTGAVVQGRLFLESDQAGDVAVWESPRGKVLGLPDGSVKLLTYDRVAYPDAEEGAAFLREQNGEVHHLSSLVNPDTEGSNMRTTDTAVAEVVRNGVLI